MDKKGRYEVQSSTEASEEESEHETWGGRLDFLFTSIGFAVGLGNIWRFPYVCYKNGGGSFLIPYTVFVILGVIPLFMLEYSISQYSSSSAVKVWNLCPLMKGLGWSSVVVSAIVCTYYNVIMSWVMYFLYQSFTSVLPWSTCNNPWNTDNCYISGQQNNIQYNSTSEDNVTISSILNNNYTSNVTSVMKETASEEFWRYKVLQITSGIENLGGLRLELLICLLIFWTLLFICLCRGVKVAGKVVYFTALFPYLVLTIFLVRGVTLPGSTEGLIFYLKPRWDQLLTTKVWGEAALQVFFSCSIGWGGLTTFASYNKFHTKYQRDVFIVPIVNGLTSFYAGLVTFSIVGFVAREKGMPVETVFRQGPGLTFVTSPEAIAKLPVSPLWSILFFLMLLTVGMDSSFGYLETIIAGLTDEFPRTLKNRKVLLTGAVCAVEFLLGIVFITQGGVYALQLVDWYVAMLSVMMVCVLESLTIGWIYGIDRIYSDMNMMLGYRPSLVWAFSWKFVTPLVLVVILVFNMTQIKPVSYGDYQYPSWAIGIGWIVAVASVLPTPINAIYKILKAEGTFVQRIRRQLKPELDWGPSLQVESCKEIMLHPRSMESLSEMKHKYEEKQSMI